MKPYRGTSAAMSVTTLLLLLSAPAALSQSGPPDVRVEMVERYVAAFNTGEPGALATVLQEIYEDRFLESFGGASSAAWDRLELFRTYGPVTLQYVDEEARPPIVWTKAEVSRGWIGYQLHLSDEGEPKVVRQTTWRARPVPYPSSSLTEEQVADSMRQYLERMADAGLFSGSAVLSRHGDPVLTLSVGDDRRPEPTSVTDETRFHIASVTKLLTVTGLLQLVEAGTIGLEDPIGRWIPEYPPPYRDQVTVRQLLTHTSGIELDDDPAYLDEIRGAQSAEQLLEAQIRHLEGREPRFAPGSEYDYTSEGIDLLGVILERVEGRPWTEVIRDRVLRPAGMTRTRFRIPRDEGEWALGWTSLAPDMDTTIPGRLRPSTEILTVVAKPSSGAWSTAGDLHRFARALLDHRLLGPAWTDSLLTPRLETGELPKYGIRSWVGLGAQGEDLWGTRTVGHGGVVPGYSATIEYLPDNGWLLTTVSNTGEATAFLVFQRFLELVANGEDVSSRSR